MISLRVYINGVLVYEEDELTEEEANDRLKGTKIEEFIKNLKV